MPQVAIQLCDGRDPQSIQRLISAMTSAVVSTLASGLPASSSELRSMVTRVEHAVAGRRLGGVAADADGAPDLAERGYSFVVAGTDMSLLGAAARAATQRGAA